MALVKTPKNAWAKTRPPNNPYVTIEKDGWTWKILKAYQSRKKEKENPYARVMCQVTSPMTYGSGDMGDVYIRDIPFTSTLSAALIERERLEDQLSKEA